MVKTRKGAKSYKAEVKKKGNQRLIISVVNIVSEPISLNAVEDRPIEYDLNGLVKTTKDDLCDCFDLNCEGCHFPCEACGNSKCGIRCRVNRKWAYDKIEHDGKGTIIENPLSINNNSKRRINKKM